MGSARQLSVEPSRKLKMPWCVQASFAYLARRHSKPAIPRLKSCWWTSVNNLLSVQKKRHTQKAQVIAAWKTAQIVATAFSYGSKHYFQLFKDDGSHYAENLRLLADAGYQGLAELHENCQTPFKKSKYHALTKREKQRNRVLARKRMVIEHIFRKLKVFRILNERYRNRRKRFALRFNLIAAIYNLELHSN